MTDGSKPGIVNDLRQLSLIDMKVSHRMGYATLPIQAISISFTQVFI